MIDRLCSVIGTALILLVGIGVGWAMRDFKDRTFSGDAIRVQLRPIDIDLHFISDEDWERIQKLKGVYGIAGSILANTEHKCEIYIPTSIAFLSAYLNASPTEMFRAQAQYPVEWNDQVVNQAIAHEVSHCLVGTWHP